MRVPCRLNLGFLTTEEKSFGASFTGLAFNPSLEVIRQFILQKKKYLKIMLNLCTKIELTWQNYALTSTCYLVRVTPFTFVSCGPKRRHSEISNTPSLHSPISNFVSTQSQQPVQEDLSNLTDFKG